MAVGLAQQVERVTGKFVLPYTYVESESKTLTRPNGDTFTRHSSKIKHATRIVEEGYMVYFPQGHSIFVAMDETDTIARLGLTADAPVVDYSNELGTAQTVDAVRTPKQAVQASLARRGGRQGGLEELVIGGSE